MPASFRPFIACYHAVSDSWPNILAVPPFLLERQLQVLIGRNFRPAPMADVLAVRRRLLHVTFDDAFASVTRALPILERLGVPATVFVCTGFADEGRLLDIPELAADAEAYPGELDTLDWAELAALPPELVEIGSHTISHAHLTQLDDVELARELSESRRRIEEEVGRPCLYLAYPFGEEDARVRAAAREAGYSAAVALPGSQRSTDPYAVPRVGLFSHDVPWRTGLKAAWMGRHVIAPVRLKLRRRRRS
jgi:peptidoglycan/xylan/chitin deacetylase (PgdA/CDA1 family)